MIYIDNETYSFKLTSGEEMITKVLRTVDDELVIHDPVSVAPGPQGVGLVPSMFTADPKTETRLKINSIAISALTDASVKAKYIEATTGLAVPTKKLILG